MSILIKGRNMPENCQECFCLNDEYFYCQATSRKPSDENVIKRRPDWRPLIEIQPHGDLIDRDALIKDGWLNLHKEVMRMGGYAIHELPLKNPSIAVIIPAEESEDG